MSTDTIGFASVALPGTAGAYVQLPNIPCDEIGLGSTAGDITLAASASPGSACITVNTSVKGLAEVRIPTGGNAQNLYFANVAPATAQTVGFMWLRRGLVGVFGGV